MKMLSLDFVKSSELASVQQMRKPLIIKNGKVLSIATEIGIVRCSIQFKRSSISLHLVIIKNLTFYMRSFLFNFIYFIDFVGGLFFILDLSLLFVFCYFFCSFNKILSSFDLFLTSLEK